MKKGEQLKIVNAILLLFFVIQAGSGILHSVIPHKIFYPLHEWVGRGLVLLVVIHVVYNFNWIKSNFLKKSKSA